MEVIPPDDSPDTVWVSVGIGDIYSDFIPSGGTLYLPYRPGVKGYTFGSGSIDLLPGTDVPVWDSVWVYPIY